MSQLGVKKPQSDFEKQLKNNIFKSLNLFSADRELKKSQILAGTHMLNVKYEGGSCTVEKIKLILYKFLKLYGRSILFRGAEDGCVTFVYQISSTLKSYMLQLQVSDLDTTLLTDHSITQILIDDLKTSCTATRKPGNYCNACCHACNMEYFLFTYLLTYATLHTYLPKATGLISSLINVNLSQHVPFHQLQQLQCFHHGAIFDLLCTPFISSLPHR